MERLNPIEVSIAYDELRAKFRRRYPEEKALTKTMLAEFFGIKASMLYNPSSYRDLLFLTRVVSVIKNVDTEVLRSFVCWYKKWLYNTWERFNKFFGKDESTNTSDWTS